MKGGLIVRRHDEMKEEIGFLASQELRPTAVCDEPVIHTSRESDAELIRNNREEHGDLLIRGLFEKGIDAILDIRVVNPDSSSYRRIDHTQVVNRAEREKKRKYEEECLNQRKSFTPFVTTTDGFIGVEGEKVMKRLAGHLTRKWKKEYAPMMEYVRSRISMAMVRATHQCLRGSRVPVHLTSVTRPLWDDGRGIGLYQFILYKKRKRKRKFSSLSNVC